MKRVAECVSTNVRLRRYTTSRVRQQTFKFDQVSKTIKSQYYTGYSLDIPNSGRNNQLRVTTTNSRWW
jgi:hypoxanthine-guanine phosphoribosyltransferase